MKQLAVEVSFFRRMEDLTIQIPALPRPTLAALQKEFTWTKGIESDISPTEAVTMELATILRPNEEAIGGREYERRLGQTSYLGFQHALWFVEHQDDPKLKKFKALCEKICIDFPGLKVVGSGGRRGVPGLGSASMRWYLSFGWLEYDFHRGGRLARSCK